MFTGKENRKLCTVLKWKLLLKKVVIIFIINFTSKEGRQNVYPLLRKDLLYVIRSEWINIRKNFKKQIKKE